MGSTLRRGLVAYLTVGLCFPGSSVAAPADEQLATGIRQVHEGDFETALVTLEQAAAGFEAEGGRPVPAAQARLYLGVCQVALGRTEVARHSFRAALEHHPDLHVSRAQFSPKVVRVFEQAREELTPAPASGGSKTAILLAAGAGAALAVALAAGGDSEPPAPAPTPTPTPLPVVSFDNARFSAPFVLCDNGSQDLPLPFTVLVDAQNGTSQELSIDAAEVVMTIVASPSTPEEVGSSDRRPASADPSSVGAGMSQTVRVESHLTCSNSEGSPARYNEWTALVSLETSAGVFNVATADRMRVNNP